LPQQIESSTPVCCTALDSVADSQAINRLELSSLTDDLKPETSHTELQQEMQLQSEASYSSDCSEADWDTLEGEELDVTRRCGPVTPSSPPLQPCALACHPSSSSDGDVDGDVGEGEELDITRRWAPVAPSSPPRQQCALAGHPSSSFEDGDVSDEGMAQTHLREVGVRHRPANPCTQPSWFSENVTQPHAKSEEKSWASYMDDFLHNVSQTIPAAPWFQDATPSQPSSEPAAVQQRAWTTADEHRRDASPFSASVPSEARQPLARRDGPLSVSVPSEAPQPLPASSSDSIWPSPGMWFPLAQNQTQGPGGLLVPARAPPLARRPSPHCSSSLQGSKVNSCEGSECTSPLHGGRVLE